MIPGLIFKCLAVREHDWPASMAKTSDGAETVKVTIVDLAADVDEECERSTMQLISRNPALKGRFEVGERYDINGRKVEAA